MTDVETIDKLYKIKNHLQIGSDQMKLINININEKQLLDFFSSEIRKQVQGIENELVYWDAKELQRRTCMSWTFIQQTFFHDPRFPKFKVNSKWLFPATEARQFLTIWLKEQAKEEGK